MSSRLVIAAAMQQPQTKTGQGFHPDPFRSCCNYRSVAYARDDFVTYGAQAGSPSPADATTGFVVLTAMPHEVFASCVWLFVAVQ